MPTETIPIAADAATQATDGVMPSKPMTMEEAAAILKNADNPRPASEEIDPLLAEQADEDPLLSRDSAGNLIQDEEPAVEVEQEAEPEGEKPAEEAAKPAVDPADEEAEDAPKGRKRLNINRRTPDGSFVHDSKERAAMQLADERGIGVIAAYNELFGDISPVAKEAEKPAEEASAKEPTVSDITSQINALRAQRKEAAKSLDTEKSNDLTEQIEDLLDQKNLAVQRDAERGRAKQTQAQQAKTLEQASIEAATKLFPDAAKDGSELNTALTLEIARLDKVNPSFFKDPEWPEALTAKLAARFGIAPISTKTPAKTGEAKPAAKPTPPKQAARPAPSPGGIPAARVANAQDMAARIQAARDRRDMPALDALVREARALQ